MKDPAFLFYTKDFQSGTQDLSCEEVGAYLRLLMYQHQHGKIPNEQERLMRITGIFSVEKFKNIWEMVKEKFNQKGNHLVNQRLNQEMSERSKNKPKKIAAATLAGLISSSKISKKDAIVIKNNFDVEAFIYTESREIKDLEEIKKDIREWFKNMVNQMVNNIANANASINKDIKGKGGVGEKPIPSEEEFLEYGFEQLRRTGEKNPEQYKSALQLKFQSWKENDWKTGGDNPRKIKNWKTTLLNTLQYLTPNGKSNSQTGKNTNSKISGRSAVFNGRVKYTEFTDDY